MSGLPTPNTGHYEVELPSGGKLQLQSPEEVELWTQSHRSYVEDYHLSKTNDLVLVGAILQQQVTLYRAQCALNGMEAELDAAGVPTGRYLVRKLDADENAAHLRLLNTASDQIQKIEKALGIDKVSREAGGTVSVENYLRTLKRAAHERGIRVLERVKFIEGFANELKTKVRMLENCDAEDRAYHNLTPENILKWAGEQLAIMEEHDKKFAREKGKVYLGKL